MTVCIAVACDVGQPNVHQPKLIMVSDTLLSIGITSADGLKGRWLADTWSVMIAGDDVTYAMDVISRGKAILKERKNASLADVAFSMVQAYKTTRLEQIEQRYLSSYNMTVPQFLDKGSDYPTLTRRQSMLDQIEKFDLGCEFLVSGFSPKSKNPYIFLITNPGRYIPQSLLGYWAIGSGDVNAITYLAKRNQGQRCKFETSLYNAIAAKKLAEKAEGVGERTVVYILRSGETKVEFLIPEAVQGVVDIWENEESAVRPLNLEERVRGIVNQPTTGTLSIGPMPEPEPEPEK